MNIFARALGRMLASLEMRMIGCVLYSCPGVRIIPKIWLSTFPSGETLGNSAVCFGKRVDLAHVCIASGNWYAFAAEIWSSAHIAILAEKKWFNKFYAMVKILRLY